MQRRTFLQGLLALPLVGLAAKAVAKDSDGLYQWQRNAIKKIIDTPKGEFAFSSGYGKPLAPIEYYHVVGADMQQIGDFIRRVRFEYPRIQFIPVPIQSGNYIVGRLMGFRNLKIVLLEMNHDQASHLHKVHEYVQAKRENGNTVKIIPSVADLSLMFPDHLGYTT